MILVMIVRLQPLLGGLVGAFHSRQDLILEKLPFVSNCSSCMLNDLVGGSPLHTSSSGFELGYD
jgi:hypothetical protein